MPSFVISLVCIYLRSVIKDKAKFDLEDVSPINCV